MEEIVEEEDNVVENDGNAGEYVGNEGVDGANFEDVMDFGVDVGNEGAEVEEGVFVVEDEVDGGVNGEGKGVTDKGPSVVVEGEHVGSTVLNEGEFVGPTVVDERDNVGPTVMDEGEYVGPTGVNEGINFGINIGGPFNVGKESGPSVDLRDGFVYGIANKYGSNLQGEESEDSALGVHFESEEDIGVKIVLQGLYKLLNTHKLLQGLHKLLNTHKLLQGHQLLQGILKMEFLLKGLLKVHKLCN